MPVRNHAPLLPVLVEVSTYSRLCCLAKSLISPFNVKDTELQRVRETQILVQAPVKEPQKLKEAHASSDGPRGHTLALRRRRWAKTRAAATPRASRGCPLPGTLRVSALDVADLERIGLGAANFLPHEARFPRRRGSQARKREIE